MSDTKTTEQVQPAANEQTQPAVKIVEIEKTIVDVSGIDTAISAKEELMQYVDETGLAALKAEIAELQTKKVQASQATELKELEEFRKAKIDNEIAAILPEGINPADISGNTPAERLANAQSLAKAAAPLKAKIDELTARIDSNTPTPEQVAAHGMPLVPGGGAVNTDEDITNAHKAIAEGDMASLRKNPSVVGQLKELFWGSQS